MQWNKYVDAAFYLNQELSALVQCFNVIMEQQFVYYPNFPNFSVWRLMV